MSPRRGRERQLPHPGPALSDQRRQVVLISSTSAVDDCQDLARPPPKDRLVGFSIADADGKFVWANARIDGKDTVVVSSPQVANPTRVHYSWDADPEVNLYNNANLPASLFRTDVPAQLAH